MILNGYTEDFEEENYEEKDDLDLSEDTEGLAEFEDLPRNIDC
jgi:hypothetical protein